LGYQLRVIHAERAKTDTPEEMHVAHSQACPGGGRRRRMSDACRRAGLSVARRQDHRAFRRGGPADVYARFIGQHLQETFKQSFVVENRPGAGSVTGTNEAAKSPPMVTRC
jgi:hypothetical protein